MKTFTRAELLKLPKMTIYSRINDMEDEPSELMYGLWCKTSEGENDVDWIEQNLISEIGFPNDIKTGYEAFNYQINLRDTGQEFKTDLECSGREGMFDDKQRYVVWDKDDITKLIDYLNDCL